MPLLTTPSPPPPYFYLSWIPKWFRTEGWWIQEFVTFLKLYVIWTGRKPKFDFKINSIILAFDDLSIIFLHMTTCWEKGIHWPIKMPRGVEHDFTMICVNKVMSQTIYFTLDPYRIPNPFIFWSQTFFKKSLYFITDHHLLVLLGVTVYMQCWWLDPYPIMKKRINFASFLFTNWKRKTLFWSQRNIVEMDS